MISRDEANLLLGHLAERFGIFHLELNEVDTVVLAFGDMHELIIEYVEKHQCFVLWCAVASIAQFGTSAEQGEIMRYLLNRNFPTKSLDGSYFATDSELSVVLLARQLEVHLADRDGFMRQARIFAEQALEISSEIDETIRKLGDKGSFDQGFGSNDRGRDTGTFIKV